MTDLAVIESGFSLNRVSVSDVTVHRVSVWRDEIECKWLGSEVCVASANGCVWQGGLLFEEKEYLALKLISTLIYLHPLISTFEMEYHKNG